MLEKALGRESRMPLEYTLEVRRRKPHESGHIGEQGLFICVLGQVCRRSCDTIEIEIGGCGSRHRRKRRCPARWERPGSCDGPRRADLNFRGAPSLSTVCPGSCSQCACSSRALPPQRRCLAKLSDSASATSLCMWTPRTTSTAAGAPRAHSTGHAPGTAATREEHVVGRGVGVSPPTEHGGTAPYGRPRILLS